MRKGRDGEWKKNGKWKKNNGENSGPLTSLQVDRLMATDCNAAARANFILNNNRLMTILFISSIIPIVQYQKMQPSANILMTLKIGNDF